MSHGTSHASDTLQRELAEFAELNRRRLFGAPPLTLDELERWRKLRDRLEARFGPASSPLLRAMERRAYARLRTHLRVRFASGRELRSAWLHDLSEGGVFLATEAPLDPEAPLRLVIEPGQGEAPIEVTGRVAWVRRRRETGRPAGMGVRFDPLLPDAREAIRRLLARGGDA